MRIDWIVGCVIQHYSLRWKIVGYFWEIKLSFSLWIEFYSAIADITKKILMKMFYYSKNISWNCIHMYECMYKIWLHGIFVKNSKTKFRKSKILITLPSNIVRLKFQSAICIMLVFCQKLRESNLIKLFSQYMFKWD